MKEGFTLIELLVVITLIGLVAAAMLSSGAGAMKRARLTAAQNHGRTVSLAASQWLSQSPVRQANALNGRDCTQATTLSAAGPVAGYQSGALGWGVPKTSITCTISATGRSVNVQTSTDGTTFTNGEP